MPRWEPDAPDRLMRAAIDLFIENGYDTTTVAQIAERAGLTKSSFFRHYRDKREVLFGENKLRDAMVSAVMQAPYDSGSSPETDARLSITAALHAADGHFTADRRDAIAARERIVASNPELRERDLLKADSMIAGVSQALRQRGTPEPLATVVATLGWLSFGRGLRAWLSDTTQATIGELVDRELDATIDAAALLSAKPTTSSRGSRTSGRT